MPEPVARETQAQSVLLVEDDEDAREAYREHLERAGYSVLTAASVGEASELLSRQAFPAAVLDIFLPDGKGLRLLRQVHQRDPQAVVIVITGHASLDTALEALRLGAYEYLCKPFSADELLRALSRGLERRELALANVSLTERLVRLAGGTGPRALSEEVSSASHSEDREGAAGTTSEKLPGQELAQGLAALCQSAAQLCRASLAALLALGDAAATVVAVWDEKGRLPAGADLPFSPLLQAAVHRREPSLAEDVLFGDKLRDDVLAAAGLAGAVAVPLVSEGEVVGLLVCAHEQPSFFAEEKTSLLTLVAIQAAPAIQRWRQKNPGPSGPDDFVDIERLL